MNRIKVLNLVEITQKNVKGDFFMLNLPPKYRDTEILIRRLILFALGIVLLVVYIGPIINIIGTAIWICLPFLIGAVLAFVLNTLARVLMNLCHRFLHWKTTGRWVLFYKVLTLVLILSGVAVFLATIVPQAASSLQKITTELPGHILEMYDWALEHTKTITFANDWLVQNEELFQDAPTLITRVGSFLATGTAGESMNSVKEIISSTFSWLWIVFLSLVFSIICFFNTAQFVREGKLVGRAFLKPSVYKAVDDFMTLVARTFSQYIGGTVLECLILGTLVTIGGLILQIPDAALFGMIIGICALVPMFGATAGGIFSSLLIFMDSPVKGITFLIMFLAIQQIEGNFIYPNVVGKSVGLPPMYVIIAITIGGSLAGILGMIVSIPVTSVIYGLITQKAQDVLARKQQKALLQEKEALERAERAEEAGDEEEEARALEDLATLVPEDLLPETMKQKKKAENALRRVQKQRKNPIRLSRTVRSDASAAEQSVPSENSSRNNLEETAETDPTDGKKDQEK